MKAKLKAAIAAGRPITQPPPKNERMMAKIAKRPLSLSKQHIKHVKGVHGEVLKHVGDAD